MIGIWNTKHALDNNTNMLEAKKTYSYKLTHAALQSSIFSGGQSTNSYKPAKGYHCEQGDTIKMVLDLNAHQLSYQVNGKDFGIAFRGIKPSSYTAGVCIVQQDDYVQLVSYNNIQAGVDDKDDAKSAEVDKLRKERKEMIQENEVIINSLQQRITELEKDNNSKDLLNNQLRQQN